MEQSEILPWLLGVPAALIHGTGYVLYNIQTKKGESKPYIVTWAIWSAAAIINAFTFTEVSTVPQALQYFVGSFAAITTLILALRWKKFGRPTNTESFVFALCIVSLGVYLYFRNAAVANLIILISVTISFHPVLKGVYKNPKNETPLSWWVWTAACTLTLLNTILTYSGDSVSVVNPIYLVVFHMIVAFMAHRDRKGPIFRIKQAGLFLSNKFYPYKNKLGTGTMILSFGVGIFGFPHQIWKNYSESACGISIVAIGFAFTVYFFRVPYLISTRTWYMLPVDFIGWISVGILISQWFYYN